MTGEWSDLARPPLRQAALRSALVTPHGPYARLDVVPRTASTNADLVAVAADRPGWPDLSVLTAEHQAGGRGRLGRAWVAPPRAALAVSVLLRPSAAPVTWGWLALLAGLAVTDALRRVAGVPARLKWPNDVVLEPGGTDDGSSPVGGKVCGVLCEAVAGGAVVVGAGVNVDQRAEELPAPVAGTDALPATSLRLAGATGTDRDPVLRAYLRELATLYAGFEAARGDVGRGDLAARVRQACCTLGRPVRVEVPAGPPLLGTAEEVDDAGRLVVRDAAGVGHRIAAGDVVHVRPG